ncbi:hypothetical protein HN51_009341, partial [Arachis hypogaea]
GATAVSRRRALDPCDTVTLVTSVKQACSKKNHQQWEPLKQREQRSQLGISVSALGVFVI